MAGLMDPDRLADLREGIADNLEGAHIAVPVELAHELLADRDHWEAEATKWRARCQVTAEDVERIRTSQVELWSIDSDWVLFAPVRPGRSWSLSHRDLSGHDYAGELHACINRIAKDLGVPPHDILDEIAAVEVGR